MQGHLMAFQSHRPESRVETQLVLDSAGGRGGRGGWFPTGPGDMGLVLPTEALSHLTLQDDVLPPHCSLQWGCAVKTAAPSLASVT